MPRLPPSIIAVALVALVLPRPPGAAAEAVVELAGDWGVRVADTAAGVTATGTFVIGTPDIVEVLNEKIPTLPLFNPTVPGWVKGVALEEVKAAECTVIRALDPESLVAKSAPGREATLLERGRDWDADTEWGTVGRLAEGRIAEGQSVWASYRTALRRIDSVVRLTDGTLELVRGGPQIVLCEPPSIPAGSERLVNVYLPGRIETLSDANLFPILESVCAPLAPDQPPQARARLPETLRRLESGGKLKILAWGDSVTTYGRWQSMFVERLKAWRTTSTIPTWPATRSLPMPSMRCSERPTDPSGPGSAAAGLAD